MRSIMHAYSAVHSADVKEELDSSRDQISEMRLTQLTDSDLVEVAEEILEGLFAGGFSVAKTQSLLEAVLCESDIPGRQQKVERLQETFSTVISKVKEKSARTAIESFAEYRHSKSVNEAWVNKFETDKGNVRLHNSLVAQDRLTVKTGLLQMLEKAKSPAAQEEKLRKDDDLFGSPRSMSNKQLTDYRKKGSKEAAAAKEKFHRQRTTFKSDNLKEDELQEKQKDTPDQVKAVIAYDKARKGTDDATYDSEHGDKKQAKKERDYAKWQRDKGAEDAQKSGHPWEHAKGSTREKEGKKSVKHAHIKDAYEAVYESGSAIKDPSVKQPLKGELKDLRKGIKGNAKGIKDADEVSQVGEGADAEAKLRAREDRGRDLARKAEADAKKRGLKVTGEEWKPYPKEKVERQKSRAYDKEMIARKGKRTDAKDKEADKQYERRMAMDGHPSKMRKVEEEVVDEAKVDAGKTPHEKETARNKRNTPAGGNPKFDRSVFITRKSGESLDSARGRKRRGAHDKRRGVSAAPVAQWKGSKDKVVREGENWIQGAVKRPGAFTKKAKEAGMSVQQFASHVDKNKSKYSTRTERQANLAQTFAKMKKEGYDFDAIQEGLTKEGYPVEEVNWVMANGI